MYYFSHDHISKFTCIVFEELLASIGDMTVINICFSTLVLALLERPNKKNEELCTFISILMQDKTFLIKL